MVGLSPSFWAAFMSLRRVHLPNVNRKEKQEIPKGNNQARLFKQSE